MFRTDRKTLLLYLLAPLVVGHISMLLGNAKNIFQSLNQPFFAPSAGAFVMIWTVLYLAAGYAACLILESGRLKRDQKDMILGAYWLQLILIFFWSPLFFRLRWRWCSLFLLFAALVLTGAVLVKLRRFEKPVFALLVPYYAWLCFVAVLNFSVNLLN